MKKLICTLLHTALVLAVVAQPPTISSFSPTSGPVGTTVTITGTNFSVNASDNIVYFGAVKAPVVSASPTSLTVTTPAGATYQPITVTANGLTGYANKPFVVTSTDNCHLFSANSFEKLDLSSGYGSIDIGDFDGDGKSDLIIQKSEILRNTGSSGNIAFTPGNKLGNSTFMNIAIGDVDGDGKLDVVAILYESSKVAIFKNTSTIGIISFTKAAEYVMPIFNFNRGIPYNVVIGDLDIDGRPDVIVSSDDHSLPNHAIVTIFKNTSTTETISFETGDSYPAGSKLQHIQLGDVNMDNKPDLVTREIRPNKVSVFKNASLTGTIHFDAPVDFPVLATTLLRLPPDPLRHTIGDIDGDGKPDLVLGNGILRNLSTNGTIAFAPQVSFPEGDLPAIGDLDGDGKPDIALDNGILKNLSTAGAIAFAPKVDFFTVMQIPSPSVDGKRLMGLAIGDLDGDGKPDIAAQPRNLYANETPRVFIYKNVMPLGCISADAPTFISNVQQTSCSGNDGQISITPTSGTPPFQYSIDGGVTYIQGPDNAYTFTNLRAGTYLLRLKDSRGLESVIVSKVIQPATFRLDHVNTRNASCDSADGTIEIDTKCGIAPYHLRISGNNTEITSTTGKFNLSQLSAGVYTITITDDMGTPIDVSSMNNQQQGSFEVIINSDICPSPDRPTFLNDERIVLQPSCAGNDGQISIIPISGLPPFGYSINGGATYIGGPSQGYTFINLAAGTYRLRLKDANNVESAIVSKDLLTTLLQLERFTTANASCNSNNGTIDIITKCGKAPYRLRISGKGEGVVSESGTFHLTQLSAGLYTISITDADGMPVSGPLVSNNGAFEVKVSSENCPATCPNPPTLLDNQQIVLDATCGRNDGQVSVIPTKGTPPFLYSINGGITYVQGAAAGLTFKNLAPGLYRLRIKDASSCESEIVSKVVGHLTVCTTSQPIVTVKPKAGENKAMLQASVPQLRSHPNPSKGRFQVQLQGFRTDRVQLQIVDASGSVVQTRTVNAAETTTVDVDLTGKAKGLYMIRVVSDKGTQMTKVLLQ